MAGNININANIRKVDSSEFLEKRLSNDDKPKMIEHRFINIKKVNIKNAACSGDE